MLYFCKLATVELQFYMSFKKKSKHRNKINKAYILGIVLGEGVELKSVELIVSLSQ